jgi:hypothetical protein
MIPKVTERKITTMTKPGGKKQYVITVPKEYAERLEKEGIDSLFIIFNRGLGAFPKIPGFTEKALITFMQKHKEFQKMFTSTNEAEKPQDERKTS